MVRIHSLQCSVTVLQGRGQRHKGNAKQGVIKSGLHLKCSWTSAHTSKSLNGAVALLPTIHSVPVNFRECPRYGWPASAKLTQKEGGAHFIEFKTARTKKDAHLRFRKGAPLCGATLASRGGGQMTQRVSTLPLTQTCLYPFHPKDDPSSSTGSLFQKWHRPKLLQDQEKLGKSGKEGWISTND